MSEELERTYPRVGRGRLRARLEGQDNLLELEDSSHWEVSPGHEVFTKHWFPDTEITVVPGDLSGYPYDLINLESGERVAAKYLGFVKPQLGWRLADD